MPTSQWEADAFLAKITNVVPGIVYVFNQKTQSNEYTNSTLAEILGYSSPELVEMGDALFPTLCHPDDLPRIGEYFASLQQLKDGETASIEYRMRHKSDYWVWLLSYDTVFDRDEDGSVARHIGVATDITAQKSSEAAAAATRDELETIFNAASSGIVAMDEKGVIVRINSTARHMLGGIVKEVPFEWPETIQFLDPETMQPLIASADPLRRALAGHSLQGETHLLRRHAGPETARYVRVGNAAVEHRASGIDMVLVLDDVSSEERNRQVIERKSRLDALGQLTGGIAHDFNNLLASLLYAIDLAGKAERPDQRASYLETAAQSVKRGSALTARLLAFARRQPGLASVRSTADVFEEFKLLVRPMIEEHFELELSVSDPDLRHRCDQTQLETALMNLVLNARDAMMRSGEGSRIQIKARPVLATSESLDDTQHTEEAAEDGAALRYVEISVSDNGPGMDEETLKRCTDPFFTTKESNSGTGLGLAIVYGFITQSNGDLRIYSEEGIGTTVQMTLPRGTALGTREAAVQTAPVAQGNGETILVVEDEFMLLSMMTDLLEKLDYDVVTASSGQEALEKIEAGEHIDLLLTDVVMPGKLGGFELARLSREIQPDLPVVYMSGYTGFTDTEMGAVRAPLLQKPAPAEELGRVIATALKSADSSDDT
ncbi:hybrid sensor histidine kinase/response regulator [Gymnodinialimonas hymeniacidonis]|uniref:hybrid sensor histidine kinase/response regulator n=1 Tax=Gymnodinialimonas hymeniacidonis TaxID=3126508 RepID=UPI0034C6C5F8